MCTLESGGVSSEWVQDRYVAASMTRNTGIGERSWGTSVTSGTMLHSFTQNL